jgi:hypothetical protein
MTTFRSEEVLVGIVALALLPFLALRLVRGVRDGQLPLYRTRVGREIGAARFNFLLALNALALVIVAVVAADLLLGLGLRERL